MRVAAGKGTLSGTNNSIYAVAAAASYSKNFHDITSGTNGTCGVPVCTATTGYDYVTGLGSPKNASSTSGIIPALAGQP